jgi:hypothetical protein
VLRGPGTGAHVPQADAGTRTPDPFITSEVLYQLSYVGVCRGKCSRPSSRSFGMTLIWLVGSTRPEAVPLPLLAGEIPARVRARVWVRVRVRMRM